MMLHRLEIDEWMHNVEVPLIHVDGDGSLGKPLILSPGIKHSASQNSTLVAARKSLEESISIKSLTTQYDQQGTTVPSRFVSIRLAEYVGVQYLSVNHGASITPFETFRTFEAMEAYLRQAYRLGGPVGMVYLPCTYDENVVIKRDWEYIYLDFMSVPGNTILYVILHAPETLSLSKGYLADARKEEFDIVLSKKELPVAPHMLPWFRQPGDQELK